MRYLAIVLTALTGFFIVSTCASAQTIGIKDDQFQMFAGTQCDGVFICHVYFPQNTTGFIMKINHVSCEVISDFAVIGSALGPVATNSSTTLIRLAFFDFERSKTQSNNDVVTYLHATPDMMIGTGRYFAVRVGSTSAVGDQLINCAATGVILP